MGRAQEAQGRRSKQTENRAGMALAVLTALTALLLAACGGGGGGGSAATAPETAQPAPTIATQPQSQTFQAGQTASLSVLASGSGSLAYQWYRGSSAIAGATAASYTTAALAAADDGAVFSVRVTGAGGTVTSASVTLTLAATSPGTTPQVVRLSVSEQGYALATRADGAVLHWGSGMEGGTGTAVAGTTAKLITGIAGAAGVDTSSTASVGNRSLVVTGDGRLFGWGRNWRGSLGVTYTGDDNLIVNAAVQVTQLSGVVQAMSCSSGASATYALLGDGSVWLVPGVRTQAGVISAARVAGLPAMDRLALADASGLDCHLLAVGRDGSIWRAAARQSDYDNTLQRYTMLVTVERDLVAPAAVRQISCKEVVFDVNHVHCLALTSDGAVWAWGYNGQGQLGLGDQVSRTIATRLPAMANVKKVLAVLGHSYALTSDGQLYVWGGSNSDPMVGGRTGFANNLFSDFWSPGLVPSINDLDDVAVAPYGQFVTALKRDGTVWSWGQNQGGVFGDGTAGGDSSVPVQAIGLSLR